MDQNSRVFLEKNSAQCLHASTRSMSGWMYSAWVFALTRRCIDGLTSSLCVHARMTARASSGSWLELTRPLPRRGLRFAFCVMAQGRVLARVAEGGEGGPSRLGAAEMSCLRVSRRGATVTVRRRARAWARVHVGCIPCIRSLKDVYSYTAEERCGLVCRRCRLDSAGGRLCGGGSLKASYRHPCDNGRGRIRW